MGSRIDDFVCLLVSGLVSSVQRELFLWVFIWADVLRYRKQMFAQEFLVCLWCLLILTGSHHNNNFITPPPPPNRTFVKHRGVEYLNVLNVDMLHTVQSVCNQICENEKKNRKKAKCTNNWCSVQAIDRKSHQPSEEIVSNDVLSWTHPLFQPRRIFCHDLL